MVRRSDIYRATLPAQSGNTGYLGFAPDGSDHHVVVPVDEQIARGIKAGNRPEDGTPFGGYRGWVYYQCSPCEAATEHSRVMQTDTNAAVLVAWAKQRGIDLEIHDSRERDTADAVAEVRLPPANEHRRNV
jgi:hypothetical protein